MFSIAFGHDSEVVCEVMGDNTAHTMLTSVGSAPSLNIFYGYFNQSRVTHCDT